MKLNFKRLFSPRALASDPKRLLTMLIFVGLITFFNTCSSQQSLYGRVLRVSDGDTIVLLDKQNNEHRVRFYGIDAPEKDQPYGDRASEFLAEQIEGKNVKIIQKGTDKYKRMLGIVEFEGSDINKKMVEQGLAWSYSYYSSTYDAEQMRARAKGVGLWADDGTENPPIEPYKWRKSHKIGGKK